MEWPNEQRVDLEQRQVRGDNYYSVSTANLYSTATVLLALQSNVDTHIDLAHKANMHGVEVWFKNPLINWLQGRLTPEEYQADLPFIISAHQSARGESLVGGLKQIGRAHV